LGLDVICLAIGHEWQKRAAEMHWEVTVLLDEIAGNGDLNDEEKKAQSAAVIPKVRSRFRIGMWIQARDNRLDLAFLHQELGQEEEEDSEE
jgi:hypothetical protein